MQSRFFVATRFSTYGARRPRNTESRQSSRTSRYGNLYYPRTKNQPDDPQNGHVSPPKSGASIDRYELLARSPSERRKVRNGPRPAKRAAAESTLRALDSLPSTTVP